MILGLLNVHVFHVSEHIIVHLHKCLYLCMCVRVCLCACVFACPLMRNSPGTLLAFRDEEVLEVKAGDPVLQQQLLLHGGGGDASGSRPSQAHTIAKTQAGASAGLGGEAGLEAGRMVMGRETTIKSNAMLLFAFIFDFLCDEALHLFIVNYLL